MRPGEKIKSLAPWQLFTIAAISAGVVMDKPVAVGCELVPVARAKAALILAPKKDFDQTVKLANAWLRRS
jgi:hypothetical protein